MRAALPPAVRLVGVVTLLAAAVLQTLPAQTILGRWEGEIDDPERPVVAHFDFDGRMASFSGGNPIPITLAEIAGPEIVFELTGGGRVLRFSGRRDGDRMTGTVVRGGMPQRFWAERLPAVLPPKDRVDAWRQDIDAIATRFLRYDRSFDEATRVKARAALTTLSKRAGALSDGQLIVQLSRIIALSGNAHTRLYFIRNRTEVSRLPVRLWWFGDELRVVRSSVEHRDLLGCQVVGFERRSANEAFRLVRDIKAGNASWQRYMSVYYLTSAEVMAAEGVISDASRVPLRIRCRGTTRDVTLQPLPVRRSTQSVEAWWDLVPAFAATDTTLGAFALPVERTARYARNARENYWFEWIPEDRVLYFQYNRAEAIPTKPMSAFVADLVEEARRQRPAAFVVDVRFNTGGDLNLATPLVEAMASLLRDRPVFVLTGRSTFSAGLTHAAQWKQRGAVVVGERVGDGLDFWSEGGNLILPNSQLAVHYTNAFHKYSQRDYPALKPYYFELAVATLEPEVLVQTTWQDYLAGRDPLYEQVRQRLR